MCQRAQLGQRDLRQGGDLPRCEGGGDLPQRLSRGGIESSTRVEHGSRLPGRTRVRKRPPSCISSLGTTPDELLRALPKRSRWNASTLGTASLEFATEFLPVSLERPGGPGFLNRNFDHAGATTSSITANTDAASSRRYSRRNFHGLAIERRQKPFKCICLLFVRATAWWFPLPRKPSKTGSH